MQRLASQRVPETNASVCCASTAAHHAMLVRVPSDSFHCSHVFTEFGDWLRVIVLGPDHQLVVVAPWSKLLFVWTPFQATDFLLVPFQFRKKLLFLSHVSVQYGSVSWASTQERTIPSYASNSGLMSFDFPYNFLFLNIPVLKNAFRSSDCQMVARAAPANTCDLFLRTQIVQFCDFTCWSTPQIHARTQSNCQYIRRAPVNKV